MKTAPAPPARKRTRPSAAAAPPAAATAAPARPDPAPSPEAPPAEALPREERIRITAYALYEQRGQVGGHELDDWLQAEALVDTPPAAAVVSAAPLAG